MREKATIFDVKRNCSADGPGIRTTVFFKGCPLDCVWCQNPEWRKNVPVGEEIVLNDLLYRVLIDKPFFTNTHGGVTLSGGEATLQMRFASSFLQKLEEEGVHTALETCGFFDYASFRELLLPHLRLIYFDLKLIDNAASRRYTGRSNRLILANFERLAAEANAGATVEIVPRIPLVPGITDSEENLAGLARFLLRSGHWRCVLMPYNPLWLDKMERLGLEPRYEHRRFMSPEDEETCVSIMKNVRTEVQPWSR